MSFSNQSRDQHNRPPLRPDPNQSNNPRSRWLGGGLLILAAAFIVLNIFSGPNRQQADEEVPYSRFLEQVESGQVAEAVIAPDQIRYQLKSSDAGEDSPETLRTVPVQEDDQLTALLRSQDVEFSAVPPQDGGGFGLLGWLIFPLIIYAVLAFLIRRGAQGGPGGAAALGVGKSKARLYAEGDTRTSFEDVAGVDEAKAELEEVVDFLRSSDKYTRLGAKVPKGVLLIGPPGTGKTLLARAVAGEANVPFLSISGSEFIEMFVGVGASRVRDLFEQAKKQAPCIVFIDELDALGRSRGGKSPFAGGGFSEQEQTLNQLLNEMDGFDANNGVIILAATNRPEVLDPALQRPGRFDRQVLVDRPDRQGREAILKVHTPGVKLADDVDLSRLAARTPGFAGADLENLVNEAALLAARRDGEEVKMSDFSEAIERVIAGLEKKSRVLSDEERTTVAYHEVGHAIIGSLMPGSGKVEKISIVPRGVGALGYTLQLPEEDKFLAGEDELRGRIAILLGGRSSEELVFGKVSTGAGDDIQKATEMAERFVTVYGMSDRLGPIAYEKQQNQFIPGMESPRRSVSPQVMEAIDDEIKIVVDGAHHMALKVLMSNREVLEKMAQDLLKSEVLEKEALTRYLSQVTHPEGLQAWLTEGHIEASEKYLQDRLHANLNHSHQETHDHGQTSH
jgi:cell division protease FtsH